MSRHCEELSLRGAVIARPQAEAILPQPRAAGSASPQYLRNVGDGRPAPRTLLTPFLQLYLQLIHQIFQKIEFF